jgi:hypothetical protein
LNKLVASERRPALSAAHFDQALRREYLYVAGAAR